jgi:hypothetical protein
LARCIHPDDQARLRAAITAAVPEASVCELALRVRGAGGAWDVARMRAVPVLDAEGTLVEWLAAASAER